MSFPGLTLPRLSVLVNGQPLDAGARESLGEIRVTQKLSLPSQCEITFFKLPATEALSRLRPGAHLQVLVGPSGPSLFDGDVTAVEYVYEPAQGRRLRVRGYDLCHRLRKRQSVRIHRQSGLREIATELVGALGLAVDAPAGGPTWHHLLQHGQTDFEFLAAMSARCGLYFAVREGALHLFSLEGTGDPIALDLGRNLHAAAMEINGDPACRAVATQAWDPMLAQPHRARVGRARVGRSVSAEAPPAQLGGQAERILVNRIAASDVQAEAFAQAELDVRIAREVVLRGVAEGDPRLRPGTPVTVSGVAAPVAGRYVLTEVVHILNTEQGFISEISTCPPLAGGQRPSSDFVLGTVTSVADPDGLGRVRVSLLACGDLETDWMGVVMVGAGPGKGIVVLPDVGDSVLVLCAQGDPAQGIVLGGLYGAERPPENGAVNGSAKRFIWRTPAGQLLRFDDEEKTLRVEDANGSFLEFAAGKVRLHAEADLEIEAPGKTITVRGSRIDFVKG